MGREEYRKIKPEHLGRKAYLYVRQSTIRQVLVHTESTERQYALRRRAVALGWEEDQIVVIDSDLGQSAASSGKREGFQKLVAEVGMGHAGVVMGLEVSRLARSSSDWHRLLEICGLSGTLIMDEDGLYDPTDFNDRLLLGLKGTMSEAELHLIRSRLQGGLLNKAQRGELRFRLPAGFVYDPKGRVVLDPDKQVQQSIRHLFQTFRREGSAHRTVKQFGREGLRFPTRIHCGPNKGELVWVRLTQTRVTQVLHNPRYAGAYAFMKTRTRKGAEDRVIFKELPRDQWHVLLTGAHEGYISWEEYEENQKRLQDNTTARKGSRTCPPREGPALLQGLAVCGKCGSHMGVRYYRWAGIVHPYYWCQGVGRRLAEPHCQTVPGLKLDQAVGELLCEVVSPMALETALAVQAELQSRIEEADRLRRKQVDRARYEAELARRRFMQVDPENRLVAASLESEWNDRLRALAEAREAYERQRESDRLAVDGQTRAKVLALAGNFPKLWKNPNTPARDRKRMARLILEDVTLLRKDELRVHIRFKGGATRSFTMPKLEPCWETHRTPPEVVKAIDRLLDTHTYAETAEALNERGLVSGYGKAFDGHRVMRIMRHYKLETRQRRLKEAGLLTLKEIAAKIGVHRNTVKRRRDLGTLGVDCRLLNDMGEYMYEDPGCLKARKKARVSRNAKEV